MSELTDLEICKRIAEIEGIDYSVHMRVNALAYTDAFDEVLWFNPLTDDGLCFRLMIKHEIRVVLFSEEVNTGKCKYLADNINGNYTTWNESPNKAIILAIIKESK